MIRFDDLPIAIIGAGPVGLAAAAHLLERRLPFVLLEAGPMPAQAVRHWSHVRLFSPWRELIDPAARRLLTAAGWRAPDPEAPPTAGELVEGYLAPLAALPPIGAALRTSARVVRVGRLGLDKLRTAGREALPFEIRLDPDGPGPRTLLARAVIDASGTWQQPNPLTSSGYASPGEEALSGRVAHGIPDVLGRMRDAYAGKRVLVAGSGHSAMNIVIDLVGLAQEEPATRTVWVMRKTPSASSFGGGGADALEARGALGLTARRALDSASVELAAPFQITGIEPAEGGGLLVRGYSGQSLAAIRVDRAIAATGFRPDHGFAREIRLDLDPWLEAPRALAPLIDPNLHSCGTVPPHGAGQLAHPEPGYFIVGIKSYGRAPTFLLLTGYEQVRSVAAELAGDHEAARRVELVLPETGVCSAAAAPSACCGPAALPLAAEPASACCGGPAPGAAEACCLQDAEAKAADEHGCGCTPAPSETATASI